jgi:phage shock protein PspC (stress-responsive transcriptional regulator)
MMGAPSEFQLLGLLAILANVLLLVLTLRWIGGGNFLRAMGSQVLTVPNRRIPRRGILGGVVAGLAYGHEWPLKRARLVAAAAWFLTAGFGALHYLALWRWLAAEEAVPWDFDRRTGGSGVAAA